MRAGWLTDIHLDWLDDRGRAQFYARIHASDPDAILLGGDIGLADSAAGFLRELEDALQIPIYFVFGNHDYYGGSIVGTRNLVTRMTAASRYLHWLTGGTVVELTPTVALIGHDGWADGRLGDYVRSDILLNDYFLIEELSDLSKDERAVRLNGLGDEAADALGRLAPQALESYRNLFVLTHVPPFREACWHEGQISNDLYLPHFACRAVGNRLAEVMSVHPESTMTVLCGHTHSSGFARILDNLVVYTGGAEYGEPVLQRVFDLG